uniref:Large ribosomal subunit protein bL28m n=2 Tax=Elapinae TaxID=42168 RepID=A0A8C6XB98_NAJNA
MEGEEIPNACPSRLDGLREASRARPQAAPETPSRKAGQLPPPSGWAGSTRRRRKRQASGVDSRAMPLHKVPPRLWDSLRLQRGVLARLPPHYLRALREDAAAPPPAVHWRPPAGEYARRPGPLEGVRQQVVPVPVYFPPESQEGLWGGEGYVAGYRYAHDDKLSRRLKKVWKPQVFNREFYSQILDRKLRIAVTMRTLEQMDKAFGFDFYILKTPKSELCSKLGMDLKRTLLLRLARKDPSLHPDDPAKREAVYNKYKEFVIPEEEAEWIGLSLEEAVEKQRVLEKKVRGLGSSRRDCASEVGGPVLVVSWLCNICLEYLPTHNQ